MKLSVIKRTAGQLKNDALSQRILSLSPHALTVMNAIMGTTAIAFAVKGRMPVAYFFIIAAVIFDTFDGITARKLRLIKTPGDGRKQLITIGGILDDIADGLSFCIAPALMFYFLFHHSYDIQVIQNMPYGWVALFYAIMGIARLVYFTKDTDPIPGFFKGMPTPAGALLVSASLLLFQQSLQMKTDRILFWSRFCFVLIIFCAVLMNLYPIHYIHVARSVKRSPTFYKILAIIILCFVFTPYFGYFCLFLMLLYALSPVITWRIQQENEQNQNRNKKKD